MLWFSMLLPFFGLFCLSVLCLGRASSSTLIQSLHRRQPSLHFIALLGVITTTILRRPRRSTPSFSSTDPMLGLVLTSDPLTDTLNGLDAPSTLYVLVLTMVHPLLLAHIFRRQGSELLHALDQNVDFDPAVIALIPSIADHFTNHIQAHLSHLILSSNMD